MTILLPRYRESTDEAVSRMVGDALRGVEGYDDGPSPEASPGEVVFYRITPERSFIWLAEFEFEGYVPSFDDEAWHEQYEEALN